MLWMIRPGMAPTYVRRWPRISASSCTPPRLIRTNLRPKARAMDFPSEVLPTPGGPTRHRSEEHTSELQSPCNLVCRLLLEKKKKNIDNMMKVIKIKEQLVMNGQGEID